MGKMGICDLCTGIISLSRLGITTVWYWRPAYRTGSTCNTTVGSISAVYSRVHNHLLALYTSSLPSTCHRFTPLHYLLNTVYRLDGHPHSDADFSGHPLLYHLCPHGSHLSCESTHCHTERLAT